MSVTTTNQWVILSGMVHACIVLLEVQCVCGQWLWFGDVQLNDQEHT